MEYLHEFIAIGLINLLGAMSPGPDFVIVTKVSLSYSRRAGLFCALGVGLGIFIHVAYSLMGIGLIVSQSIVAYSIIKYLGAAYLIYIGYKSLRSKPAQITEHDQSIKEKKQLSSIQALKTGFLTNALNPKATVFFVSIFTQVIDPQTPISIQALYGIEAAIIISAWFCLVALLFSNSKLKNKIIGIKHHIERVMGAILILLGLKIATESNK